MSSVFNQVEVFVKLLRRHPDPMGKPVRHRTVTGDDDTGESLLNATLHILDRMTFRMLAQRSVHVAVEKYGPGIVHPGLEATCLNFGTTQPLFR